MLHVREQFSVLCALSLCGEVFFLIRDLFRFISFFILVNTILFSKLYTCIFMRGSSFVFCFLIYVTRTRTCKKIMTDYTVTNL